MGATLFRLYVTDFEKEQAEILKTFVLRHEFRDVINPVDGVIYPGIAEMEKDGSKIIIKILEHTLRAPIKVKTMFARMMTKGVKAPHKVHDDHIMGDYSAHIYLSENWPRHSGTAFYYDEFGSDSWTPREEGLYEIPYNDMSRWEQYALVPAKFGRLLVHKSELWHCALPTEGFGSGPHDARLVLTCFFDLA